MNQPFSSMNNDIENTLQSVLEEFAYATDFGSIIVDIHGKEKTKLYNFSPFCLMICSSEELHSLCQKCDMYRGIEASKTGEPSIYHCHAGLNDSSLPINDKQKLSNFLLFGQVETNWRQHLELQKNREKIPTVSEEKIKSAATLLKRINDCYGMSDNPRDRIIFNVHSKKGNPPKNIGTEEIRKAIQYMQKNITRQVTLEEVADHVYLSQYYFSKLFKKEIGINFVTYLNQERIERAKALLKESSLSIDAISNNLGFSQTSYFCKIFKSLTNNTPAKYRKEKQAAC
jgi:ligand-binding sensor protein/AraC-like DNA-binding protein